MPPSLADARKKAVLAQLYRIHDQYIRSLDIACAKHCHDCCTANVTMTTLEGDYILSGMAPDQREKIVPLMRQQLQKPRFIPTLTTNRIAQACRDGEDFTEEQPPVEPGPCPLLHDGACRIYPVRPFGCRCMVSSTPCRLSGCADTDPFTLTINTVFLQVVEHVDRDGFTGNLCDVLIQLYSQKNSDTFPPTARLTPNSPLHVLFVPPQHRDRIKPIMTAIQALSM